MGFVDRLEIKLMKRSLFVIKLNKYHCKTNKLFTASLRI